MIKDIPNILTVSRIALIPVLIMAFYIEGTLARYIVALIFIFASITDYLDGLLARKLNAYSSFGRVLDPIADKLLVASTLVMLIHEKSAPIVPAILILCREITVSGLREYLAEFKVSIPVTALAKIKTTAQFIAMIILIIGQELGIPSMVGEIMIWLAAILTLITGYAYCKEGFKRI